MGPLTLKQFIFAAIAAVCLYLSFFATTKHAAFLLAFFLPVAVAAGFLAWPWSRDQPTEIWLLAKIRFFLKPRKRIWDQDGIQELVTITVPKKIEHHLTNDLSQTEVTSRLRALADTIDSRGWAIKNVNINLSAQPSYVMPDPTSDRLIDLATLPQEVPAIDVGAADDMMDPQSNPVAQHLDQMIGASTKQHRQQLIQKVKDMGQQPAVTPPTSLPAPQDLWFTQQQVAPSNAGLSQPVAPPISQQDERALLAQLHPDKPEVAYGHMKVIDPAGAAQPTPAAPADQAPTAPTSDPALLELASNDDLDVATIARQAHKKRGPEPPDEVVVPLR